MNAIRIVSLVCALCLGLMLGVMLGGGTHAVALVFAGLGAGLMLAVCIAADSE
jgi:hypothetical protein